MDRDALQARDKAIDALVTAVGFWGIDPLETRMYGMLFLSHHPLTHAELASGLSAPDAAVDEKLRVLKRLGAVKETKGGKDGLRRYSAVPDFFEILHTVLRERREKEMGRALDDISEQRGYIEARADDEDDPELAFLAGRLAKLDGTVKLVDKAMFGLSALAGVRGLFKGKR